ncbi:putative oxidoreductase [Rhodococcus wratislaviensis NBRC 100605]|uniref:Putative oxidoreductase n=2 Tax=Rhodococcus wratislaviensis TaxID=44752 RepID=X0RG65_RHOWR|nr:putative oxidoreductase [Rhodococcus wratislaviensis NBRC 100605]
MAGKVAVVTAAGQGIGRAVASEYAAQGATVWAVDLKSNMFESAPQPGSISSASLDVTDASAVDAFRSRVGRIDVLFNGVGMVHTGSILDCSQDTIENAFRINVISMHHMISAFLPEMVQARGGSIVNMSSIQSSVRGFPDRYAYSTTKAAIIGLTKSVAADFAASGIRCNAICPSAVDTPSMRERIEDTDDPAATYERFAARQPVGRMGTPRDIASMAVYLGSDESSFVTGSAVLIDGGATN